MTLEQQLANIGALQFGWFTLGGAAQPFALHLRLIPSYPALLAAVAAELAPLAKASRMSHLLPMPAATPLGTAISLQTQQPLVYVSPDEAEHIEGAYDYSVPTLLVCDAISNGGPETALIRQAQRHGLHVESALALIDLGIGAELPVPLTVWRTLPQWIANLDDAAGTARLRAATLDWIASQRNSR
ncbi:MAG: hypothetical protein OHK0023_08440 [Anaerolineae bacterium]